MKQFYLGMLSLLFTFSLSAQTTVEVQVSASEDDMEEYIDGPNQTNTVGSLDDGSSDLELGSEGGDGSDPQLVGIRFASVPVPAGAVILHAAIQFGVDENKSTEPAFYEISMQQDANPASFDAGVMFDISSRVTFEAAIPWSVAGGTWANAGDAGPNQRTPDLKDLVQLGVMQPGWESGNAMVFTVEGTGNKVAESYDGDPALAPKLVVTFIEPLRTSSQITASIDDVEEYIDGPLQTNPVGSLDITSSDLELGSEGGDGSDPQLVGLKFNNIDVPAGAVITYASIQFTVDENKNTDNAAYRIRAENNAAPDQFDGGVTGSVSSRDFFEEHVTWNVMGGTWTNAGDSGADQKTADIASLIQQVIDLDAWEQGGSLVLTLEGTGNKVAESFDGDAAAAPVLTIDYLLSESLAFQITSADDDLEERLPGPQQTHMPGTYDFGSSDLELGTERENGDDPQLIGLRFTGVDIEQGAIVSNAYVQFTVDENKSTEDAQITIKVVDAADSEPFNTDTLFTISGRPTLDDSVSWTIAGGTWVDPGLSGPDQATPDISNLIQQVVDNPDWSAGNALIITFEGTGVKVAESFDGDPVAAARLMITTLSDPNSGDDSTSLYMCTDVVPEGSNREVVLEVLSTYNTGVFDEGAAEIVAYDPGSRRVFFTNADANSVGILDINDPSNPTLIGERNLDAFGGGVNSVDVYNGLVAVAVEAEVKQDSGSVVLLDFNGNPLNAVTVGALPDMVTFSPDGTKILTANEGEPDDAYAVDPEGSISIVDVSGGAASATATTISFAGYNGHKAHLMNKGIRIFGPNATVAQDLEPEYVTMPNDSMAYVSCQENNALIVVNVNTQAIMDILPLGTKDLNSGRPRLTEFLLNELIDLPELGTPAYDGGQTPVSLGGFSGLWFDEGESTDDVLTFYAIPDRGPNDGAVARASVMPAVPQNLRPFKLPDYQGRIAKISINTTTGEASLDDQIFLTQKDGTTPISGRGNIPGFDEVPVIYADPATEYPNVDYTDDTGEEYHALPYDPYGGDFEGILRDRNGYFWMCDEYRPAIYHFDMMGQLIERYVPAGTSLLGTTPEAPGTYGAETLPAVYSKRRANRGFEAIAYDWDEDVVYAFIQTPLYNPSSETRNNSDVIRVLGINPADGTPVHEYVYLLERNRDAGFALGRVDKIGDAVYVGNGRFMILERDSSVPGENCGKKYVYSFSLVGATDILGTAISEQDTGMTLELMTADNLAAAGIVPVHKTKVLNLPSIGYLPSDKPEGLAVLPDGSLAVLNDNDFGLAGAGVSDNSSLGIIQFCDDNSIDASDRSEDIEFGNWPVLSYYMPDAIKSFEIDGKSYIVTANEGDSRDYDGYSEEERVDDLTLDMTAYPNAADLQIETNLGRLKTTSANGDYDNDGDYDQIYGYGGRSFSIWDQYGNLVYDSGNEFAKVLAKLEPDNFNSTNDENDSKKNRSDDKGTEPEAIEVVQRGDSLYALIGLERQGGMMVYNITDPTWPYYVTYLNNRDFSVADATDPAIGDLGLEDIVFISEEDSPTGEPLIVTANEVSGTVTLFGVEFDKRGFLVRLMHNNDGESKIEQQDVGGRLVGGAAHFKTVVDSLRSDGTANLMLSSGDNYLAGIAFNASLSLPDGRSFYDAVVIDSLEYDALCLGNHDFDFGPDILERFISDIVNTEPPFLSSNLDFTQEPGLLALEGLERIAASTIVEKDGERIGVIGLTTPELRTISSPRNVQIDDDIVGSVMAEVDALEAEGINKIILISHLQSINDELELATMIRGVDVIIAGGGDELLTNNPDNAIPGVSVFGEYPLKAANLDGDTTFVVTTPGEYRYVGNLLIEFNDDGTVFEINDQSDVILVEGYAADPGIQSNVVDSIIAYSESLDQNVIAITEVDLDGTRESIRTIETNQGNLIGDAFLWLGERERDANGLDPAIPLVAVQNGGGIRNNNIIPAGSDITEKTTFDMLPFDNAMSYINALSPEVFKSVLENAVSEIENVDGRFLQIAGFKVIYDMQGTPDVDRIYKVELDDGTLIVDDYVVVAGAPDVYVITNSFTAAGGDAFQEFADAGSINLGGSYQRTLFDYIVSELGGVIAAADYPEGGEGRIREKATVGTNFLDLDAYDLRISPNPFATGLTLQYTLNETQNVRFLMTDMVGSVVFNATTDAQLPGDHTYRINVPDLPQGMYTLIVQMNGKVGARQVVKQ